MTFKDVGLAVRTWIETRTIKFWLLSYVVIALLTFGFSTVENRNYYISMEANRDAQCSTLEDRVATGSMCYRTYRNDPPAVIVGLFSGVFWPLYWTQKTFSLLMPGPTTLPTVITKTVIQKEYIFPEDVETD